jgi:prefoldin alpha subunit
MTKDEELQRYMVMIEQYKEQLNQLEMQGQYLQAAVMDYNKGKLTLENISKADDGTESLIPIGGGVFIYATVKDNSNVILDIGSGIAAEKSFEDAIKKIDMRLETLQKNQDQLNSMIEQIQSEAADVSAKAQKLMNEQD